MSSSVSPGVSKTFWRSAIDSLTAHVAILDADGCVLAVNAAWRRFAANNGSSDPDACIGLNYLRVCEAASGDDGIEGPQAAAGIRRVIAGERAEFTVSYPCHSPKKKRWFLLRATRFEGDGPARVVIAHENITAPKAAQIRASQYAKEVDSANRQLRAQAVELTLAEALEADSNGVLELIARNELVDSIVHRVLLLLERQLPACGSCIVLIRNGKPDVYTSPHLPESVRAQLEARSEEALVLCEGPTPYLISLAGAVAREDTGSRGSDRWNFVPIRKDGKLAGCIAVQSTADKSSTVISRAAALTTLALEHAGMYERLAFQAHHDSLTELPNRLLFQERLQQAFLRRRREDDKFAVLMIDLDRFKQINDAYGHRVGDLLLRQVGHRLLACIGPDDTAARLGGDEFVILVNQARSAAAVEALAGRIASAFEGLFDVLEHKLLLTCSVGFAIYPDDGRDAGVLVRNADTALYGAKSDGRNTWKRFDSAMGVMALERMEIELHLREALRRNELHLQYQPQLDCDRKLIGVEALMRWHSPVLGSVPPGKFIPVAEESGLIVDLGNWALREACAQNARWRQNGFQSVRMAVNVSTMQMGRMDFAKTVQTIIAETGIEAGLLELEITESAMMHSVTEAIQEMKKIRRLGVRISIDDFGTGYSSLSYLQTLPVDSVKIDRSFIQELDGSSANASSVVQAIIALAHTLQLEVVAEGVETEAQLGAIRRLNCDVAQGYLLHRPLQVEAVQKLFLPAAQPAFENEWHHLNGRQPALPLPEACPLAHSGSHQ